MGLILVVKAGMKLWIPTYWIKLINYVDAVLYYSKNEDYRLKFGQSLKKRINLSLLSQAKWYLEMQIKQSNNHITLDQEQYIKKIMNRFEKNFKHQFKVKNTPLPNNFVPSKKDSTTTEPQNNEIKFRLGNLH